MAQRRVKRVLIEMYEGGVCPRRRVGVMVGEPPLCLGRRVVQEFAWQGFRPQTMTEFLSDPDGILGVMDRQRRTGIDIFPLPLIAEADGHGNVLCEFLEKCHLMPLNWCGLHVCTQVTSSPQVCPCTRAAAKSSIVVVRPTPARQ